MLDRGMLLRPIAHRGLHDASKGVIENTAPAFEAAIAGGYGVECDIRPGANGLPLVFHDAALDRLTESAGPVAALAPERARRLRFRHAPITGILSFGDFLDLIADRVPVFAEIKSEWNAPDLPFLGEVARLSNGYTGRLALMSFDPDVMAVLKELAPATPRGIVASPTPGEYHEGEARERLCERRHRALADLEDSAHAAPSFYAYDVRALPSTATARARAAEQLPVLAWTVRTDDQHRTATEHADAIIFEGYEA